MVSSVRPQQACARTVRKRFLIIISVKNCIKSSFNCLQILIVSQIMNPRYAKMALDAINPKSTNGKGESSEQQQDGAATVRFPRKRWSPHIILNVLAGVSMHASVTVLLLFCMMVSASHQHIAMITSKSDKTYAL